MAFRVSIYAIARSTYLSRRSGNHKDECRAANKHVTNKGSFALFIPQDRTRGTPLYIPKTSAARCESLRQIRHNT